MKNIKKFNEHFTEEITDGKFDFDSDDQSITMDTIKSAIIEAMMTHNEEIDAEDPKFAEGIDDLTKMIMYSFQETLSYISENYEGEIEQILSLDENY
jgi:hypothetical protein